MSIPLCINGYTSLYWRLLIRGYLKRRSSIQPYLTPMALIAVFVHSMNAQYRRSLGVRRWRWLIHTFWRCRTMASQCEWFNELEIYVKNRPDTIHRSPNNEYCHFINVFHFVNHNLKRSEAVSAGQNLWKRLKTDGLNAGRCALYQQGRERMEKLKVRPKKTIVDLFQKVSLTFLCFWG